jgi:predicted lipoprotein with Yx(FWY)xxD motif
MQIWMADRTEQAFVERMKWDGSIQRARNSDYLYVVQQNVGGNKLNYFEDQTHTMDVAISGSDALVSTEVSIHNGVVLPAPRYVEGDSEGFHRPMINVYVPEATELTNAEVVDGVRLDTAAEGTSAWPAENQPADEVTVAVAETDLGDVLVDQDGMTLYVFDNDEGGESACYDDCAANWPPVVVEDAADAGDGADAGLLGTTERTDGTTQVTYNDKPLYYWVGDDAPGDTEGQAVGDVWWAVAPDGDAVRGGDADDSEDAEEPGYGY